MTWNPEIWDTTSSGISCGGPFWLGKLVPSCEKGNVRRRGPLVVPTSRTHHSIMPRIFGRSKSKESQQQEHESAEQQRVKVKKSKSFKRIRGLLKKTRRKKQQPDEKSVYGIDVDERSVLSRPANSISISPGVSSSSYILKVVLLLMDPETRRFELLQLEFDSLKALVSDVLAQIPVSVTEEALRTQTYTGIVGRDMNEMPPIKLLATFCKGSEVLVAVPEGVPPKECVRLARPILSDDKVVTMLAASGIDASGWKEDAKKNRKKRSMLKSSRSSSIPEEEEIIYKKPAGGTAFSVLFVLLMALILQVFHTYVSAPIQLGSTTASGTWMSKCGLLTLWPSCENAFFHLDHQGVATFYNKEKEVAWKLLGSTCDDCVKGLHVTAGGSIEIGGRPVKYVVTHSDEAPELSPWPFAETPKVRVWKK